MQKYNNRIVDVKYDTDLNFDNALQSGEFLVDLGRGLHYLTKTGAGTRRGMLMAVMDWDRQVTMAQIEEKDRRTVIRGYDEPDTNLHYSAQRKMYQTVNELVNAKNSRTQAIISTHSLSMIDQSPAQNVRHFCLKDDCTTIEQIDTCNDQEVENFLTNLARQLGLTNSILFYERCFILVEGSTEENALPILYKRLYNRNMIEDGIRLINMSGNGAVKEVLRLFCQNRQRLTIIFIDKDTQSSSAKLTQQNLKQANFPLEFIDERLILIGDKEFEDSFTDITIAECLQKLHPKQDGKTDWSPQEIANLRTQTLSKKLQDVVHQNCPTQLSKPEFGMKLAELCNLNDIPTEITRLFNLAREIAECQKT